MSTQRAAYTVAPSSIAALPAAAVELAAWTSADGWKFALRRDGSVVIQRICVERGLGPLGTIQAELVLTAAQWWRLQILFALAGTKVQTTNA